MIDVATLTGAACVALGERASAIFTDDDKLAKDLEDAGEKAGDYVWRLPMWEEYENEIKGNLAFACAQVIYSSDLSNLKRQRIL